MKNAIIISLWVLSLIIWGVIFNDLPIDKQPKLAIIRITHPNYTHCARCGVPWKYVESHNIYYAQGVSFFYLCQSCWAKSTLEEKRELGFKTWKKYLSDEVNWSTLDSIIQGEPSIPFFSYQRMNFPTEQFKDILIEVINYTEDNMMYLKFLKDTLIISNKPIDTKWVSTYKDSIEIFIPKYHR